MTTPAPWDDPRLSHWPVLREARRHDPGQRLPFTVLHEGQRLTVGSVARRHLGALPLHGGQLQLDDAGLVLQIAASARDVFFADLNRQLRAAGLVQGWRDEIFVLPHPSGEPALAHIERASARFWGSRTQGAHCNGLARSARSDAPLQLWLGRRSATKSTDPGMLDNLIGGGVPAGQTPLEALQREGFEEAGLSPQQMQAARPTGRYHILRDLPEGLQDEDIFVHEIELGADISPVNQDGEVAEFRRFDIAAALRCVQCGELTLDASIATLDAAERHGWLVQHLDHATAQALHQALQALRQIDPD
jgi:8-oxo-dGTP pyrophosphatase MutT (NUDIX family)